MENGTETSSPPAPLPSPPLQSAPPPLQPAFRPMPVREDCWSEEATHTLIEAWGERYIELNRGNLRQKHWQEVADAVNALHGHTKKTRRTDIQCKNRIDTIKKKYKIEMAKDLASRGSYVSPWPFYSRLNELIGDSMKKVSISPPPLPLSHRKTSLSSSTLPLPSPSPALALTSPIPVGPRSLKPKRPAAVDESFFRRNFSAAAVAAAAAAEDEEEEEEEVEEQDSETSRSRSSRGSGSRRKERDGCKKLAEAIMRFGEIYERVEVMKQEQLIELEKHRMQFAKDLEYQRMKLLMDTQLQLAKIKRPKTSDDADSYL
ncbi:hypothetical protein Ancab_011165 [Ancistrocladus abbreviatus]